MNDPTQQGGQEQQTPNPTLNPRRAILAEIAQSAHQAQVGDLQDFNEETGEIAAKPAEPEKPQESETQAEAPASAEQQAEPKPEQKKPFRRLVVDGEAIEVDEEKVLEAGIRTLQKETAADRRLQEATRLKQQAEALLRQAQPNSAPSQQSDAQQQTQPATIPDFGTLKEQLASELRVELWNDRAKTAADMFTKEFPEIAKDPYLMGLAANLENERLAHAAQVGEPLGDPHEAYKRHGEKIRDWLKGLAPKSVEIPQDKAERKRTIAAVPAVNAKAQAPQEQKPKTTSELIEEMRSARARGYRKLPMQRSH